MGERVHPGSCDRPSLEFRKQRRGDWIAAENANVPDGARVLADNVTMRLTADDKVRIIVT